ncbi:YceI family protein [Nocardia sp. NPDC052254]|uniref:YceI family protein n=1 Tax=Nocardia sp. NPDC052254 TaxID=3155681 RepID=UPI003425132D
MNTFDLRSGAYVLDTTACGIGFRARHVIGPAVVGRFAQFDGNADLSGDLSQWRVDVAIRADSIDTGNRQRDELLCAKFLRTPDYPTIEFVSTAARDVGESTVELVGDLSIRGITKSTAVTFQRHAAADGLVHMTGTAVIDRRDWQVNWNAATKVSIGKTVALEFDITAAQRA